MKWATAGKNYYREKHVYIPLRLSTDHVMCGRALTNICTVTLLHQLAQHPFPSPSSTATNHVTRWWWWWWQLLFTTWDMLRLAVQMTTPTFQITISDHLHDSSKFFILFYIFSTNDYFPRLHTTYFLDAGTNHKSTKNHRGMKHVWCISTPVLHTAPHDLLDSVGLIWSPNVTNCHMVGPVDSAGFRWSKCWLLSRERGPVESTGLCRTGLF